MFRKQMAFLSKNGYRSLCLAELLPLMQEAIPFPDKTFSITFDDGYRNLYREAFPVMSQYGFRGTCFLTTGDIGKGRMDDGLRWVEIREMERHGFEFGAHTQTHPDLTKIPITKAGEEITVSKEQLQNHLGKEIDFFAYPFGRFNAQIETIVRNHFRGACLTRLGRNPIPCDPFRLKRIDMYFLSNFRLFCMLPRNILDLYLQTRQVPRDIKELYEKAHSKRAQRFAH